MNIHCTLKNVSDTGQIDVLLSLNGAEGAVSQVDVGLSCDC